MNKKNQPKVYVVVLTQFRAPAEHFIFFSREAAIDFANSHGCGKTMKCAQVRGPVKSGQDIDKARSIKLVW